jgi:hypothetical protein
MGGAEGSAMKNSLRSAVLLAVTFTLSFALAGCDLGSIGDLLPF